MATYSRLDDNGLLFLLHQLKAKMDAMAVTIDSTVTADGANAVSGKAVYDYVPGSKAVYDFVTKAIADISGFHAEIVSELPETGKANILYLVSKTEAASGDGYDEYLYINGAWERVGSTDIDLSGYVQASEMHAITNTEITAIVNQVWS